jgi:hypothetical protein
MSIHLTVSLKSAPQQEQEVLETSLDAAKIQISDLEAEVMHGREEIQFRLAQLAELEVKLEWSEKTADILRKDGFLAQVESEKVFLHSHNFLQF